MRIVIELQQNAMPQVTLNQLYKHTPLQSNFGMNMLALVDGVPKTLTLREALEYYLKHRLT
jgi:DNA gyrase subunit A